MRPDSIRRRALSLRAHLNVFAVAVLLPIWALLGFGAWNYAQQTRQEYEQETLLLARRLAADLEHELSGFGGLLTALASSPALSDGDYARFYDQALQVVPAGGAIVVRDRSGQHLVNTLWPLGTKLPITRSEIVRSVDACVFETGRICASDLYIGTTDQQPYVLLDAPVKRNGTVELVISVAIRARYLGDLMEKTLVPPDWTAAIIDQQNRIVARSRNHDRFVGHVTTEEVVRQATGQEGTFPGVTVEGTPVWVAYVRVPDWGWRVIVGVPQSVLRTPLRHSAVFMGITGAMAAGLSALIAHLYGRRLAAAVTALRSMAANIDRAADGPVSTRVREVNEVAERLSEAASKLRVSLAELEAVYRAMPAGMAVLDSELRYLRVSETLAQMNGIAVADHVGRTIHETVPAVAKTAEPLFRRVFETGQPVYDLEVKGATPGDRVNKGTWLENIVPLLDENGRPRWLLVTVLDITARKAAERELARHQTELERLVEERTAELMVAAEERRRAEEALRQNEKLAAIGQLTGGIAHDFNNLLQVIGGGVELLQRAGPDLPAERRARFLNTVAQGVERAREMTAQLLAFSRRQALRPQTFNLNKRLAGVNALLTRTLGPKIEIVTDFADDLWPVHADPGQLDVAVLNLALNARDAMPDGGQLTLQTRNGRLDSTTEYQSSGYICLAIKDTGSGISPNVLSRVFEPFFTTKGLGKGTGLGLAQVHGFVKQSGGDIAIESAPGQGTTIVMHLPRASVDMQANAEKPAEGPLLIGAAGGKKVLVVEDNVAVAEFASVLLEEMGCRTLRAIDASQALQLLDRETDIDVVFSDIAMPGEMDGMGLARAVRARFPGKALVLATGYSTSLIEGFHMPGVQLLLKPYRADDLDAALRAALAAIGQQTALNNG